MNRRTRTERRLACAAISCLALGAGAVAGAARAETATIYLDVNVSDGPEAGLHSGVLTYDHERIDARYQVGPPDLAIEFEFFGAKRRSGDPETRVGVSTPRLILSSRRGPVERLDWSWSVGGKHAGGDDWFRFTHEGFSYASGGEAYGPSGGYVLYTPEAGGEGVVASAISVAVLAGLRRLRRSRRRTRATASR